MTTSRSNPIDFRGVWIEVDSVVVYPVRQGSRMWLVEAQVLDVMEDSIKVQAENQKPAWIKRLDRVVVVDDTQRADYFDV